MIKKDYTELTGAVLVVGGGVGGMQSALDLAEAGFKVYLVEQSPAIGGTMPMLDKTFPTNDCSMCTLSPRLVECGKHLNIEILTCSEVVGLEGEPGNFRALIYKHPRGVDQGKCLGCGDCAASCPRDVTSEFDQGLCKRKAIYKSYLQAYPGAYALDQENCLGCRSCEEACPTGAINRMEEEKFIELKVGAVILSLGFELIEADLRGEFGHGIYPNVLTSLQFERMLSASGPFAGKIVRPTDGKVPKKIAFIQCVGSRDTVRRHAYCSAVCCMYATKQAIIAQEHIPDAETTIFYLDIRAFGKDFEKYYERARQLFNVRYLKCSISSVKELQRNKNLRLRYCTEAGKIQEEDFNLVVLSLGIKPVAGARRIASIFGVELDEYGFCKSSEFSPAFTTRPGVFAAGAFCEPKDIPETVMEAGTAGAHASALLSPVRHTLTTTKKYPMEMDVKRQPPRIGVFVCNCGSNIKGVINTEEVVSSAKKLKDVVYAEEFLFACSQDNIEKIKQRITEFKINRLVVASCTPRTHAPLFQNCLKEAGLNPYLFEQANIREQSSWVHWELPLEATAKAREQVAMAVAKARLLKPVTTLLIPVNKKALVIGGGLAGMTVALSLAEQGFETCLVEKSNSLGGNFKRIHYSLEGQDPKAYLAKLIDRLKNHPLVHIFTGAEVVEAAGYVGNYLTTIQTKKGQIEIWHGVTIIATGAEAVAPKEYYYGENPRVLTQLELEAKLAQEGTGNARNIVMIQCVGSREERHSYCSRLCCSQAIKNALKIKEMQPASNIFIIYRDMQTYGLKEKYYHLAREKGIIFIPYEPKDKPKVKPAFREKQVPLQTLQSFVDKDSCLPEKNDLPPKLEVIVTDPVLGEKLILEADLLVLSSGISPAKDNDRLSKLFKVPLNADGFFAEAHMKLRPVDFATEGIYLCGLAHSPKIARESIAQAEAAALRAVTLLSKQHLEKPGVTATVDEEICSGCGLCLSICEYNARTVDEETHLARVNEALCRGCGACVATCPNGASQQKSFEKKQIMAMIDAVLY